MAYEGVTQFAELKKQITDRCLNVQLLSWFTAVREKIEEEYPNYARRKCWEMAWERVEDEVLRREGGVVAPREPEAEDKAALTEKPDPASQSGGGHLPAPTTDIPIVEDPKVFFDLSKIDVLRDAAWVYHNLGNKKTDWKTAPSPGARAWLEHLQDKDNVKSRDAFLSTYLSKLLPRETGEKEQQSFRDDGRIVSLLDRLSEKKP
jgi:hypothetical protein